MIPYGRQDISEEDIAAVIEVLRSDFLTQGPVIPQFEESVARYCGAEYSVAVNSATSALHLACRALGLGSNDTLWTSPNTFVASANCALYCGASVDFVDIDPRTYNLCVDQLELKLIEAQRNNKLPKIVVPVHFAGQSCDMKRIYALGQQYGFRIVEDASHAIGGKYLDQPIGNCAYSDITVFSFHPVKIITTAEGGVATTNSIELAEKMRLLRSHGITRDVSSMTKMSEGDWYYQQVDLGFNYRMTEIQAALGVSQMHRLDQYVESRHQLCRKYDKSLKDFPLLRPYQSDQSYSSLHLYPIQIDRHETTKSRREVFDFLRANGIGVNVHYIPVHTQPHYQEMGFKVGQYPVAEQYYSNAISVPLHPTLTEEELLRVVDVLKQALV